MVPPSWCCCVKLSSSLLGLLCRALIESHCYSISLVVLLCQGFTSSPLGHFLFALVLTSGEHLAPDSYDNRLSLIGHLFQGFMRCSKMGFICSSASFLETLLKCIQLLQLLHSQSRKLAGTLLVSVLDLFPLS